MANEGVAFLAELAATYGDLVSFTLHDQPIYLVNHPSLVRRVLVDHHDHLGKPEPVKASNRGYWGDGVTSLDGEAWRRRRRVMQPFFHRRRLAGWDSIIVEHTTTMLSRWYPGREIRPYQELVELRAGIASRTVLGTASIPPDEARGQEFVLSDETRDGALLGMRRPRAGPDVCAIRRVIDERLAEPGLRGDVLSRLVLARDEDGRALARDRSPAKSCRRSSPATSRYPRG